MLRRWMKSADIDDGIKNGETSAEQAEVVKLPSENRRLEMESPRSRSSSCRWSLRQPERSPAVGRRRR